MAQKLITVEGLYGIRATVLAYSIGPEGIPLITWETEYPRMILAEANTHRDLSRNSASSRAIPFEKMLQQLFARPVRFGEANKGMQDKGEVFDGAIDLGGEHLFNAEGAWAEAKEAAVGFAKAFYKAKYHKQVYNRLTEPFQMMKTVVSATQTANLFWLRDDDDADPTFRELVRCMREAMEQSEPEVLAYGEWHLPYVDWFREGVMADGKQVFFIPPEGGEGDMTILTIEDAIKVSCARCAAVSYRNEDYGLEKCREMYVRLAGSEKKHASALEHCAKVMLPKYYVDPSGVLMNAPEKPWTWEEGVSHMDRAGFLWSGNFKCWVQHRKTVKGEYYAGV